MKLNNMLPQNAFVGKAWTPRLVQAFRHFWLMAGYYTKRTFAEYIYNEGAVKHKLLKADTDKWDSCLKVSR
jgi:hypothetical protein